MITEEKMEEFARLLARIVRESWEVWLAGQVLRGWAQRTHVDFRSYEATPERYGSAAAKIAGP